MNTTTKTTLNARQRKAIAKAERIAAEQAAASTTPENAPEGDTETPENAPENAPEVPENAPEETPAEQPVATEEPPKVKGANSIVPTKYKERYGKDGNCGDELAAVLNAAVNVGEKGTTSLDALKAVAAQNGIDKLEDGGKWATLNIGQKRMNLGNVLRGKLKRGEQVFVGDQTFGVAAEPEKKAG